LLGLPGSLFYIYNVIIKNNMNVQVKDLGSKHSIYGNKGNVWSNTAHIYESGKGNLCGTPALASNWAKMEGLTECGCVGCNEVYNQRFGLRNK
jgi:hypothetical protein